MFHCHILEHQAAGMMGVIRVAGPNSRRTDARYHLVCSLRIVFDKLASRAGYLQSSDSGQGALAVAIAHGRDLEEIAEAHRVTLGTNRGQLKTPMAKTDTHRQGELIALLSCIAVLPAR